MLDTGYPDAFDQDLTMADFQFTLLNWMLDALKLLTETENCD